MIYDVLDRAESCFSTQDPILKALLFARDFDPSKPDGRYEIEGDALYALVSTYETAPASELRFEAHRKYIDVQILLEGEEIVNHSLAENPEPSEEYSEERDVVFFEPPEEYASVVLRPGYFAVFRPHDLHRPKCNLRGKRRVRKMVLKVRA